ncbi:hypothetical protein PCANC_25828 [Puccinia coronata f. sp. avenae]|uniref:Uncharacterized protein n=1 Tax=Puccinia coronata f. sp. avenae TaxID=200324 RepID=A0A2N5S183_9BASI|nr:hypothetical protein PCANC_25828 [Puccinia coronata f. sp. avenae]
MTSSVRLRLSQGYPSAGAGTWDHHIRSPTHLLRARHILTDFTALHSVGGSSSISFQIFAFTYSLIDICLSKTHIRACQYKLTPEASSPSPPPRPQRPACGFSSNFTPTFSSYPLPPLSSNSHIMRTHTQTQEADSLSEFHWLFSDEQPVESLPLFFPRVLNFGQSSSQSLQGSSPFQPRPRFRREQSEEESSPAFREESSPIFRQEASPIFRAEASPILHEEASQIFRETSPIFHEVASPIFHPDSPSTYHPYGSAASPVYVPHESDRVFSLPSISTSRLAPLQPLEVTSASPRCHTFKRQTDTFQEDEQRPRKYSRLSEPRLTNDSDNTSRDASPVHTLPSTISPSIGYSQPKAAFDFVRFDHLMEIQSLRAQLAISESRNASAVAELAESRNRIDFLLNEVRRVISSGQERQITEKAQRIVRSTENNIPAFTRTSPVTTQLAGSLQGPSTASQATWCEALDPSNPYSYYFSEDVTSASDPQQATLPSPSQLPPVASFHEPTPSIDTGGFTAYLMARAPSREYFPNQSTSLPTQSRRSHDPNGSQLAPDRSHARLDSYLSFYYTEPPFSTDPFQYLDQTYPLPTHPIS